MEIREKYPLPWELLEEKYTSPDNQRVFNICDATGCKILSLIQWNDSPLDTIDLLKFIISKVNRTGDSKPLPHITDQPCQCSNCDWSGIVWDCESDEETGDLLCPECLTAIEAMM